MIVQKERKQGYGHFHACHQTPNQKDEIERSTRILQSLQDPKIGNHAHASPMSYNTRCKGSKQGSTNCTFLVCHVPTESAGSSIGGGGSTTTSRRVGVAAVPYRACTADTPASRTCRRVVIVVASGLHNLHGKRISKAGWDRDELGANNRTNDQCEEHDKDDKVQNGIADNAALAKLGLLERVDWRANLTTRSKLVRYFDNKRNEQRTLVGARRA